MQECELGGTVSGCQRGLTGLQRHFQLNQLATKFDEDECSSSSALEYELKLLPPLYSAKMGQYSRAPILV